jgi:hypothetical protein
MTVKIRFREDTREFRELVVGCGLGCQSRQDDEDLEYG